jgi:hypothetical protein
MVLIIQIALGIVLGYLIIKNWDRVWLFVTEDLLAFLGLIFILGIVIIIGVSIFEKKPTLTEVFTFLLPFALMGAIYGAGFGIYYLYDNYRSQEGYEKDQKRLKLLKTVFTFFPIPLTLIWGLVYRYATKGTNNPEYIGIVDSDLWHYVAVALVISSFLSVFFLLGWLIRLLGSLFKK